MTDAKLDKPTFPWNFLADPNGPDRELAANWIFLHLRGKAYKGYLEAGRGVLLGPFLSDGDDSEISSEDAARRHASGQLSVSPSCIYRCTPKFSLRCSPMNRSARPSVKPLTNTIQKHSA